MSDESQPPQLRLRPRKRDDEPAPVPSSTSPEATPSASTPPIEPAAPAAAPQADAPARFRLKPKLAQESDATPLPERPLASPPAPPPAPVLGPAPLPAPSTAEPPPEPPEPLEPQAPENNAVAISRALLDAANTRIFDMSQPLASRGRFPHLFWGAVRGFWRH